MSYYGEGYKQNGVSTRRQSSPSINTPMKGLPLNPPQERYWVKCLNNLVREGINPGFNRRTEWEAILIDPSKWRPDVSLFIPRVKLILQGYANNKSPEEFERELSQPVTDSCPSMKCMGKECNEDRNRPYSNWVSWWDKNNKEEFNKIFDATITFLKYNFHAPKWKDIIQAYGYFLCVIHYKEFYSHNNQIDGELILPEEKYYPPLYDILNETN